LEINWDETFLNKTIDEMWVTFKETIQQLTKLHVPVKKSHVTMKNRWISKKTIKQMKVRNVALKKYHQFSSGHNYSEYKKTRNFVVDLVRQDEDAYRKRVLKGFKGQPKRFYGHIRHLQTIKDSVNVLTKLNRK